MSDKLKEFKCDTCLNPCILMVHANDCAPDACPYSCVNFKKWGAVEITTPKHETVSQWISVKDRLPDCVGYIMVSNNGCLPFIGMYHLDTDTVVSNGETYRLEYQLTHWQPLPEAPETDR